MDRVDEILRKLLSKKGAKDQTGPVCPCDADLVRLVSGKLSLDVRDKLVDHAADCPDCTARLGAILAVGDEPAFSKPIDPVSKRKAQGMDGLPNIDLKNRLPSAHLPERPTSFKTNLKKHGWLVLSITFLCLSFFVPRYFIQFIVLTVLFGLKWVFDTATTRQMIMIYEAWKGRKEGEKKT